MRYADNLPLIPDEGTIAYIIDVETGEVYDEAGNFETAISYIQDLGYIAVAAQDQTHWCSDQAECFYCITYGPVIRTREQLQQSFDHERMLQEDCFGLQHIEAVAA